MARIRGITVQLNEKREIGKDDFGHPVYEDNWQEVDNILVAPASVAAVSTSEVLDALNLTGKKAVYTIAVPKGDTHEWEDNLVKFFGATWRVFGFPQEGIDENMPLAWNQKWMVEKYG